MLMHVGAIMRAPLGNGQRVTLFIGLVLVLGGLVVGLKPLGHATGTRGDLYCTASPDTPIGQGGDCPGNTFGLTSSSNLRAVERNCGSAFLTAAYDSGAMGPDAGKIPPGVTQRWAVVPPCSSRVSAWRYPAVSLVVGGVVIALAGFFIFRPRRTYEDGGSPTPVA